MFVNRSDYAYSMNIKEIKQWIAEGDLNAVENAWMDAMECHDSPGAMREVLESLVTASQEQMAETLGWMLLSATMEQGEDDKSLDVARTILPALPGGRELRDTAAELFRQSHGQAEHFEDFLKACGLQGTQSLRRAVRTLETCLSLRSGMHLANRFDHRVLSVAGYNDALGEFELKSPQGEQLTLEPKLLADEFEIVEDTDFRVLHHFRQPELSRMLQDDPAAVLIGLCMSHGGSIDATSLKELLVPAHLEASQWSGWWNRARAAAKRSESLSLEGRSPVTVTYHPHGRTLEEELAGPAGQARSVDDRLAVLREYARELGRRNSQADAGFVAPIMEEIVRQAGSARGRHVSDALTAALGIEQLRALGLPDGGGPCPSSAEVLCAADDPAAAIAELADTTLWPPAFEALTARPDAAAHFEKLLKLLPAGQMDQLVARLRAAERGQAVEQTIEAAMASPADHLQILLWMWSGPAEPPANTPSSLELLSRLLSAAQALGSDLDIQREARRDAFGQIRAALTANGCKVFREVVEHIDADVAATLKRRVERSDALSPTSRDRLMAVLREHFYGLFVQDKVAPWLDEDALWTTEASMRRQEEELKELLEVKIPANARAIGAAAELGDLSENSEWQYAVEEQRCLNARVAQLQNDLVRARVLDPDDVPSDSVGIGSRVVVKALADGREVTLDFLGPWDSDVPKRIYSYKTTLAQSLMGKTVGETVALNLDGAVSDYRIERLEAAVRA